MSDPVPADALEARRAFDVATQCVMLACLELDPTNAKARAGATTNPVIWQVGHLAGHQEFALHKTDGGTGILPEQILRLFLWGTDPSRDLPSYPPFAEVMDAYITVTAASKKLLDAATAENWSSPRRMPDGKLLGGGETLVEIVRRMTLHHMFHIGCIAALRKELGDKCPRGFVPGMSPEAMARQQTQWDDFWQAHRGDYL